MCLGNLAAYEADRLGFLLEMRDQFGGVVRFGARTTILSAPAAVEAVLRDDTGYAIRENFLQRRLSSTEQRELRGVRRALSPGLRPAALGSIADVVDRQLVQALGSGASDWFDPVPVMESVISAAVAEIYFGPDGAPLPQLLGALLDDLSRVIGNPFALPERWGSPVRRRIAARHELLRTQVARLLAVRLEAPPGAFDDLAADVIARAGTEYPLLRVADMVIGSLLAAQRVPAAAASWLLAALADDPELQAEISTNSGPQRDAGESVPSVVGAVVLESLRLHPPTWLLVRTATGAVEVGGFSFPAGHHFMISPYVLHRDPLAFPDPATFRADRWHPGFRAPQQFLPFGVGVHVCPGRHLAIQVLIAIARGLSSRYEIAKAPGAIVPNPRTTLLPDGLRIALRPRDQGSAQPPVFAAASSL